MDSDSENSVSSAENIPNYNQNDQTADAFRMALSQWKQKQLDTILGDKQNTTALNAYLKKTKDLYERMKNFIEKNTSSGNIDSELLTTIGNPANFSTNTRINILHTLFRDLIEFPFTYDKTLINSFTDEEALETNIIPNNLPQK